jgi:hypothetical protein
MSMMDCKKNPKTLCVVIFLYSSRFVSSMHLFSERAECWMGYILLWILYLFVIHNLRDFFLKQHLLHDIVVGFIFKVMAQELLVFEWFLHILYLLVPPQWTVSTQRRHLSINIHRSKIAINIAMVFREETTHWWDEIIRNVIENKYVSKKFIN